ncbi:MAG TPA: hypothetical protein VHM20_00235, partial [Gammaproteobacteria bacterium]|nr:hypothetical protein [Gammaproteobacteria bacterium]
MIIFIVFLIALRLLFPYAAHYKPEITRNFSESIGLPVTIANMKAYWQGWTPSIELEDVTTPESKTLPIKKVTAKLNLFASVLQRRGVIKNIEVDGGEFVIQQLPDKSYSINQIPIPVSTGENHTPIYLKNLNMTFIQKNFSVKLFQLNMVTVSDISKIDAKRVEVNAPDWLAKTLIFDAFQASFQLLPQNFLKIHSLQVQNNFANIEG